MNVVARLTVFAALWIAWCVFAVLDVVPMVLRHLTIYNQLAAWVLCTAPLFVAAGVLLMRISKEEQ